MKFVFRVDSSVEIGSGHVMRCLTLAHELKKLNHSIHFICADLIGSLISKIKKQGLDVVTIQSDRKKFDSDFYLNWLGHGQEDDFLRCKDVLNNLNPDWIIVDHYALDSIWHRLARNYCKNIMVIDDLANREYDCDLLLDQTIGRCENDYVKLVPLNCKLLLGEKYILLREEFYQWREFSLERRKKPKLETILISMGGSDPKNYTQKVLEEFAKKPIENDVELVVVLGGQNPWIEEIKEYATQIPYKTEILIDVDNMAEIIAKSDFAIGAAGGSVWERLYLGLPSIHLQLATNQCEIMSYLKNIDPHLVIENTTHILDAVIFGITDFCNMNKRFIDFSERQFNLKPGQIINELLEAN